MTTSPNQQQQMLMMQPPPQQQQPPSTAHQQISPQLAGSNFVKHSPPQPGAVNENGSTSDDSDDNTIPVSRFFLIFSFSGGHLPDWVV